MVQTFWSRRSSIAIVLCFVCVACKPRIEWREDSGQPAILTVVGTGTHGENSWAHVTVLGTNVEVKLNSNFPEGTQFEIGDQKGERNKGHGAITTVSVDIRNKFIANMDKLGPLPVSEWSKIDTGLTLELKVPYRRTVEFKLPPLFCRYAWVLHNVANGPVRFGNEANEADDAKPSDSLVSFAPSGGRDPIKVIGRAGSLSEVDYVALSQEIAKGTAQCGYHGDIGRCTTTRRRFENKVTVYARRTGLVVATRTFDSDSTCSEHISESQCGRQYNDIPRYGAIKHWLETLITP